MVSEVYQGWTLVDLRRLFVPPITLGQFYSFREKSGDLTGFITWANLTMDAELGFINRTRTLQPSDWSAGDHSRLWCIDALAPYGGVGPMVRHVVKDLREKANAGGWPCDRASWARSYGAGKVQHIGKVMR